MITSCDKADRRCMSQPLREGSIRCKAAVVENCDRRWRGADYTSVPRSETFVRRNHIANPDQRERTALLGEENARRFLNGQSTLLIPEKQRTLLIGGERTANKLQQRKEGKNCVHLKRPRLLSTASTSRRHLNRAGSWLMSSRSDPRELQVRDYTGSGSWTLC